MRILCVTILAAARFAVSDWILVEYATWKGVSISRGRASPANTTCFRRLKGCRGTAKPSASTSGLRIRTKKQLNYVQKNRNVRSRCGKIAAER